MKNVCAAIKYFCSSDKKGAFRAISAIHCGVFEADRQLPWRGASKDNLVSHARVEIIEAAAGMEQSSSVALACWR